MPSLLCGETMASLAKLIVMHFYLMTIKKKITQNKARNYNKTFIARVLLRKLGRLFTVWHGEDWRRKKSYDKSNISRIYDQQTNDCFGSASWSELLACWLSTDDGNDLFRRISVQLPIYFDSFFVSCSHIYELWPKVWKRWQPINIHPLE